MKKHLIIFLIMLIAGILRLYSLDKSPAGLNADEAAIGYNAWSLIQTGKDEHGEAWPMVFRSFDDYKPPIYFYLVLPFVKLLGLNIWAVRLPSAFLGILSVYLVYLIIKEMFKNLKSGTSLALLSSFLLATSPWHLQFSRGGWEVNASLFFLLVGVYAFMRGLSKNSYLYLFVLAMSLSMYTYHSMRIIAPLLSLTLVTVYFQDLFGHQNNPQRLKIIVFSALLGVAVTLPLVFQMLSKEGQSRFNGVSVFSDEGPLWQALELRRGHEKLNPYVRLVHNKYLSYSLRFTKNYLSHFSPRFLFISGDEIARSKVPGMGQFQIILFPFYLFGLLSLLKLDSNGKKFFLIWLIIAPLAAALTFQSPHALRAQNMTVPLTVLFSLGLIYFIENIHGWISRVVMVTFFTLYSYFTAYYLHQYYLVYPKNLPYAWQYGFDQISDYVKQNGDQYDQIIITDRYDQPYILMAFYLQYPPEILQKELVMTPRDKFGFSTVRELGKFKFRAINYEQDSKLPNTLIVSSEEGVDTSQSIKTIFDPAGKPMYNFFSTNYLKNEK